MAEDARTPSDWEDMSGSSEKDNLAVLCLMGALIDELAESGVINRESLAGRIGHEAAAHDDAGQRDVANKMRWLTRALLDEEVLGRLNLTGGSSPH